MKNLCKWELFFTKLTCYQSKLFFSLKFPLSRHLKNSFSLSLSRASLSQTPQLFPVYNTITQHSSSLQETCNCFSPRYFTGLFFNHCCETFPSSLQPLSATLITSVQKMIFFFLPWLQKSFLFRFWLIRFCLRFKIDPYFSTSTFNFVPNFGSTIWNLFLNISLLIYVRSATRSQFLLRSHQVWLVASFLIFDSRLIAFIGWVNDNSLICWQVLLHLLQSHPRILFCFRFASASPLASPQLPLFSP